MISLLSRGRGLYSELRNPLRREMVFLLLQQPRSVKALSKTMKISWRSAYFHAKKLENARLIRRKEISFENGHAEVIYRIRFRTLWEYGILEKALDLLGIDGVYVLFTQACSDHNIFFPPDLGDKVRKILKILNLNRFILNALRSFVRKNVPQTLFKLYRVENGFSMLFAIYLYSLIRMRPADLFMRGKETSDKTSEVLEELTTQVDELLSSNEITFRGKPVGVLLRRVPRTVVQELLTSATRQTEKIPITE